MAIDQQGAKSRSGHHTCQQDDKPGVRRQRRRMERELREQSIAHTASHKSSSKGQATLAPQKLPGRRLHRVPTAAGGALRCWEAILLLILSARIWHWREGWRFLSRLLSLLRRGRRCSLRFGRKGLYHRALKTCIRGHTHRQDLVFLLILLIVQVRPHSLSATPLPALRGVAQHIHLDRYHEIILRVRVVIAIR